MTRRLIGRIRQLWRYPVKSLAGESVERAVVDRTGLAGDRSWALRDVIADELTHCKAIPALLACAARYPVASGPGPGVSHAEIVLPDGRVVRTDDPFVEPVLSAVAGRPLTLWPLQPPENVRHYRIRRPMTLTVMRQRMGLPPDAPLPDFSMYPQEMMAELQQHVTPRGSYKDAYPVHFVTSASLDALAHLAPGVDLDVRRFRPNVVIETGEARGFPEHDWAGFDLIIGGIVMHCGPRTVRCAMPGQAQHGLAPEPRIGAVLRRHTGFYMGAYASIHQGGVITVGDEVFLESVRRERPLRPAVLAQSVAAVEPAITAPRVDDGCFRRLRVVWKEREAEDVVSLGLKAEGAPRVAFIPGQHLVLRLRRPGHPAPLLRSYSISSAPGDGAREDFRITVRRMGAGSSHLHDSVQAGDELEARGPSGRFFVLPASPAPLVLISSGIGVTPLFAMLQAVAGHAPARRVVWVHATRNGRTHVFRQQVGTLAASLSRFSSLIVYTQPDAQDVPGRDYQLSRHLVDEDFASIADLRSAEVFLCGTPAFMSSVSGLLRRCGVEVERIHCESFGGARSRSSAADFSGMRAQPAVRRVRFARSGIDAEWSAAGGSLLELTEELGLAVDSGCRLGSCCACAVPLIAGETEYAGAGIVAPPPGTVLLCCAEPLTDLVLDL